MSCINSIQVHSDDETNAIDYLKKAHEMAREGTTIYVYMCTCVYLITLCGCIQWSPSITDTNGTKDFVLFSEVSFAQGAIVDHAPLTIWPVMLEQDYGP